MTFNPSWRAISATGFFLWDCALWVVTAASLSFYNAFLAGLLLVVWVSGVPLIDGWPERM